MGHQRHGLMCCGICGSQGFGSLTAFGRLLGADNRVFFSESQTNNCYLKTHKRIHLASLINNFFPGDQDIDAYLNIVDSDDKSGRKN